jgi:hypothetical protein
VKHRDYMTRNDRCQSASIHSRMGTCFAPPRDLSYNQLETNYSQDDYSIMLTLENPIVWLVGSLILSILATNLARLPFGDRLLESLAQRLPWPGLPALVWLLISLYMLLLPLAAWQAGALSPFHLGLSGLDWVDGLAQGGSLIVLLIGSTIFGWLIYRRTLPPMHRRRGKWTIPIDIALTQWHWAFYRAAMIGWLLNAGNPTANIAPSSKLFDMLQTQPLYWGAWIGFGLIVLEGALNPFTRVSLNIPGRRESIVRNTFLAVATTALFFLTRNFWLCLITHMVIEISVAWLFPGPEPASRGEGQGHSPDSFAQQ